MPSVLFKFRQGVVGLTADIEDMFYRVRVNKTDASARRFLWRGMKRNCDPQVYEMSGLIFRASCSPSIAQEARNKNATEYFDLYPEAVQAIIDKHYVDDYLDSCDCVDEAINRFQQVHRIPENGNFKICKWVTNSPKVLEFIPEELRAHGTQSLGDTENSTERI